MLGLLFSQSGERTLSATSPYGSLGSERLCRSGTSEETELEQGGDSEEGLFRFIRSPVIDQLVDIYFELCHNRPYSFFHEDNFRRSLANHELPDHLLLAMVATTLRFSSDGQVSTKRQGLDAQAASSSWRIIGDIYLAENNTDIHVVQTLALLSIFDFTAGKARHGSAWVKIGIAIRLAQNMKLMLQPPDQLPFESQEERRRVFWSLYILDRLASCGRGHPATILETSCQLSLPCDELSWRNGKPSTSAATLNQFTAPQSLPSVKNSPFALVVLCASVLGRATHLMLQGVDDKDTVPPWDHRSNLAATQSNLICLEPSVLLQKPLQQLIHEGFSIDGCIDQPALGPLVFSQTLFHLCYCILYHPFLLNKKLKNFQGQIPSSFLLHSFETAYEHAKQLVLQIDAAQAAGCRAFVAFYSYAAVVAGSILALCPHDASESMHAEANSIQQVNVAFLARLGQWWNHTPVALSLLQRLIRESHKFSASTWNTLGHTLICSDDEEFMWTLLDYNAWSSMGPEDVRALDDKNPPSDLWPDMNDFCNTFPQFDWELLPGTHSPLLSEAFRDDEFDGDTIKAQAV
ncbi:hypothetical protein PV08_00500 [Exophiala spinifera]|uniref:Xylanolytic transcriptional activator regulatory domain-containing protein n=1 Tax=Exophiala spinifera TaxID=91928 RepID=A0A0D2BMZ7_9EURO|nr:uncharacterized protein PV08_00500 [Exophiala spinifera]KIW19925.1 hypothetical protein PV08_00500 [Exophiala spinifera]